MNTPESNRPSLLHLGDQSMHELEQTTIIGRHEDCNLVLKSERGASRKHARITIDNDAAVLMDLGSLNGTMVNGREISRAVQLAHGDIVVFDEQEYQFVNPTPAQQNSGDNVTVIANKDEIGRPESIKPAIRVVDTSAAASANLSQDSVDDTEAWEIPATSRPGGDAITPKRLQNKQEPIKHALNRPAWMNWAIIVPVVILLLLVAFYFAYTAGFSAGTSGLSTRSS